MGLQLENQHNLDRRSLFYWDRVYNESIKKGQEYAELPNVIAVNIVDFNFPRTDKVHTCFHLREDADPSLIFSNALEIHCVNMVQWRRLKGKDIRHDPLHRWLARFDRNSSRELIEEVAKMDSGVMAANNKLNHVIQDEETRRIYMMREKARRDLNGKLRFALDKGIVRGIKQGRVQGIEQGRVQGIEQGREQSAAEITRNLKKIGLSIGQIAEATGLSPEDIERL